MLHQLNTALSALVSSSLSQSVSVIFTPPKNTALGDLGTPVALKYAKQLNMTPLALAEQWATELRKLPEFSAVTVAVPGYINVTLHPELINKVIAEASAPASTFGCKPKNGQKVLFEYVSANPTGPLHLGHARQAVIGDVLAATFATQGYDVHKEYYYNDAGVQIDKLVSSIILRGLELQGTPLVFERDYPEGTDVVVPSGSVLFPRESYHGDYIIDLAKSYNALGNDWNDKAALKTFAVDTLRAEQAGDLAALGTSFDSYALESSLFLDGKVSDVLNTWQKNGYLFEDGGATWFKSSLFGDDKDRVAQKKDGGVTYFVPDVAYHLHKWQRGYTHAINIQGWDHDGTTARVQGGLQALNAGIDEHYPAYVLHKMLKVVKGGKEVSVSKRAGGYVTLQDMVQSIGKDSLRYVLCASNPGSDITLDVDVLSEPGTKNPVFYGQYAHARFATVLSKFEVPDNIVVDTDVYATAPVKELVVALMHYPVALETVKKDLNPSALTTYIHELSAAAQAFYSHSPKVVSLEVSKQAAYRNVMLAVKTTLASALGLLGVSAPSNMPKREMDGDDIADSTEMMP